MLPALLPACAASAESIGYVAVGPYPDSSVEPAPFSFGSLRFTVTEEAGESQLAAQGFFAGLEANMTGAWDLLQGTCASVGGPFSADSFKVQSNASGVAQVFELVSTTLDVNESVLGRAVVLLDADGERLGCGIISNSSTRAASAEVQEEQVQAMCEAAHPFDTTRLVLLKAATIFSALLSVGGSFFIMATWMLQRGTRRSLGMHVIFCLSVADFFSSLVFIIDGLSPTGELSACSAVKGAASLCAVEAAAAQFFGLSTILWTGCIALGLHLGVLRRSKVALQQPDTLLLRMHMGVWGTSALVLLIMRLADTLGPTGQWCWVRLDAWWAMLVFYYAPLLAVFGYSMGIFNLTRQALLNVHREAVEAGYGMDAAASSALPNLTKRLRGFLLVFGVIHFFQLLNRAYDGLSPGQPSFFLYLLHSILGPIQGFANAFVYGWSPLTRRVWSTACPGLCGWAAPKEAGSSGLQLRGSQAEVTLSSGLGGDQIARIVSEPDQRL